MTDRELDERIAKALYWACYRDIECTVPICPVTLLPFSPSTSVDALRKWVLPEIARRGLVYEFLGAESIWRADGYLEDPYAEWFLLTAPPAVLASAALEVLEGDNE